MHHLFRWKPPLPDILTDDVNELSLNDNSKMSFIKKQCKKIEDKKYPNMHRPEMKLTFQHKHWQIRKFDIGKRRPGCQEKVIMMVGATGSGKSTLINGFLNYFLGIDFKDNFRLKLIEENPEHQAYSIHKVHHIIHHSSPSRLSREIYGDGNRYTRIWRYTGH